jgi:hypothetical protein
MPQPPWGERFPGPDAAGSKEFKEDLTNRPIYIYVVETQHRHENHVTKQGFGFSQEAPQKTNLRYVWEGRLFGMPSDTKSSMSHSTVGDLAKNFAEAYRQHQPQKSITTTSYEFRFTAPPDGHGPQATDADSEVIIRDLTLEEQAVFVEAFRRDNMSSVK